MFEIKAVLFQTYYSNFFSMTLMSKILFQSSPASLDTILDIHCWFINPSILIFLWYLVR